MDPLSLTASIIAVVQAAASVEHGLAKLLAVRGANDHLLQTINEVSDLRAILHDIHATIKSRDECTMGESKALETLPALCTEIQRSIQELDTLVAGCIIYEPRDGETPWKVKRIAWLKANEKMKAIQNELRESRLKLSTAIASMLSLDLLHVRLTLREISAVSSSKSGSSDHSEALIKISKRFDGLTQIPDQISEILSILKPVSSAESSSMLIPVTSPGYGEKDRLVTRHVSSAVQPGSRLTVDRGIIRLKFGEHPHRARGCACTCHGTSTVASSPWIEGVVGRLFIGYNGQIASLRPCMECPCVRNRNTKISFTYYFPSWLLSRSLEAVLNVTRLGGPQFALRAYRSMPDETLLFHLARQGNIPEIQTLFRDGLASPFDISAKTGRSALHFAVDFGQEETCHFLLRQGADPHYEDKYFMSPFDIAWEKKSEGRPSAPTTAFGLADNSYDMDLLQKRGLSSLHGAVIGFSRVKVVDQLSVSWNEINRRDFFGRTCLSWASGCGHEGAVRTLVEWGADLTITDQGGWTPLHHAVRAESPSCITLLLEAGAPVDTMNNRGNTPLAVACSYRDSPDHVLPLLQHFADPAKPMSCGMTPLAITMRQNYLDCAQLLLDFGASINGVENKAAYPLHEAVSCNSYDALSWLLDKGADASVVDEAGWSLFHHVAYSSDIKTISLLTEAELSKAGVSAFLPLMQSHNGETASEVFSQSRRTNLGENKVTYEAALDAFGALLDSVTQGDDGDLSLPIDGPSSPECEWFDAKDTAFSNTV